VQRGLPCRARKRPELLRLQRADKVRQKGPEGDDQFLPGETGLALSLTDVLRPYRRGRKPVLSLFPEGGRWGLPADFLIDRDSTGDSTDDSTGGGAVGGTVVAVKYGEHAYDQWTVDEVLELAAETAKTSRRHSAGAAALHHE